MRCVAVALCRLRCESSKCHTHRSLELCNLPSDAKYNQAMREILSGNQLIGVYAKQKFTSTSDGMGLNIFSVLFRVVEHERRRVTHVKRCMCQSAATKAFCESCRPVHSRETSHSAYLVCVCARIFV